MWKNGSFNYQGIKIQTMKHILHISHLHGCREKNIIAYCQQEDEMVQPS
jgi:hypothetical protein